MVRLPPMSNGRRRGRAPLARRFRLPVPSERAPRSAQGRWLRDYSSLLDSIRRRTAASVSPLVRRLGVRCGQTKGFQGRNIEPFTRSVESRDWSVCAYGDPDPARGLRKAPSAIRPPSIRRRFVSSVLKGGGIAQVSRREPETYLSKIAPTQCQFETTG
jgi:hypothetical protein